MKLFPLMFLLVLSKDLEKLLTSQNLELQTFNEKLHKQLLSISKTFVPQIQDDYYYNKQKAASLILEYDRETDKLVKILLVEELLQYLIGIIEDANLLGGAIEGISCKVLLQTLQDLKKNIRNTKQKYFTEEITGYYNELHKLLLKKQEFVQELQSENAKLYGKIESKLAEIKEVIHKTEKNTKNYEELSYQLQNLKSNYNFQSLALETSIQGENPLKLTKLSEENTIIPSLQSINSENSLEIQRLSGEISMLLSKQKFLTDASARLQNELDSKSLQISAIQGKFEEFSAALRTEAALEIFDISKSQEQLYLERNELDEKERSLNSQLGKCRADAATLDSILKNKGNMIEETNKDLKETELRYNLAVEQKTKEIDNLASKYSEYQKRIQEYEQTLDESLKKVLEKDKTIQDLQDIIKASHKDTKKKISYFRNP
jgi:hypothetical protein